MERAAPLGNVLKIKDTAALLKAWAEDDIILFDPKTHVELPKTAVKAELERLIQAGAVVEKTPVFSTMDELQQALEAKAIPLHHSLTYGLAPVDDEGTPVPPRVTTPPGCLQLRTASARERERKYE